MLQMWWPWSVIIDFYIFSWSMYTHLKYVWSNTLNNYYHVEFRTVCLLKLFLQYFTVLRQCARCFLQPLNHYDFFFKVLQMQLKCNSPMFYVTEIRETLLKCRISYWNGTQLFCRLCIFYYCSTAYANTCIHLQM